MDNDVHEQERLNKKKRQDDENEKLWRDLQIEFRLEAFKFPDNKIYGIVKVIPESCRKLIQKFILVVNNSNRIEFAPDYVHLSASGFNINRKNPSAYIEAVPIKTQWSKEVKTSKLCYFFFTGETFALSPTISFDWSDNQNDSLAILVIKWYHIGDKYAHKYILHLDDTEIQYIRQKLIDDAFNIQITGFKPGNKHTFQLSARLNNGKETYRSDLKEFIVPDKPTTNDDSKEFITVGNEPAPSNLPAYIATADDKIDDEVNPKKDKQLEKQITNNINKKKKTKNKNKNFAGCDCGPHDTFPGIEHYFRNFTNKKLSSSSSSSDDDDDDDDDVIIPTN